MFSLWNIGTEEVTEFSEQANKHHPTIKSPSTSAETIFGYTLKVRCSRLPVVNCFYLITKPVRALWLVNQLWFIVPANSWKNRASSELLYKSKEEFVNHSPAARDYEFFSCSTIPRGLSAFKPQKLVNSHSLFVFARPQLLRASNRLGHTSLPTETIQCRYFHLLAIHQWSVIKGFIKFEGQRLRV